MENIEKMENQMTIFMTQNTLFVNQMTQNTLFYVYIYGEGWKILTYPLGEHDPGSAQDGRTSSEMAYGQICVLFSNLSMFLSSLSRPDAAGEELWGLGPTLKEGVSGIQNKELK